MKRIFLVILILLPNHLFSQGTGIGNNTLPFPFVGVYQGGNQYPNITAAKNNAAPGSTIYVFPKQGGGAYTDNNLLKSGGINYHFFPGAILNITNTLNGYDFVSGLGAFDDRGSGAVTSRITGALTWYWSPGTNLNNTCHGNTNSVGFLVLTNPASDIYFEFDRGAMDVWVDCQPVIVNGINPSAPAGFYISLARQCIIKGNDFSNPNLFSVQNGVVNNGIGGYWESGPTFITIDHLAPFALYGMWANDRSNTVDNFYTSFNLCESYNYASLTNSKWWFAAQEVRATNGAVNSAFGLIGGLVYIQAQKITCGSGNSGVISSSMGNQAWITAQKLTAPVGNNWLKTTTATNYLNVMQLEGPGSGIVNAGGGITYFNNSVVSNSVAPFSIVFPATTVNWTNLTGGSIMLYIDNTGVTGTLTKVNGIQIFAALVSDVELTLKPNDYFSETYTIGTPTGKFIFQ